MFFQGCLFAVFLRHPMPSYYNLICKFIGSLFSKKERLQGIAGQEDKLFFT